MWAVVYRIYVKITQKSWIITLVMVIVLVALDQLSKQLALVYLSTGETFDFLGGFFGLKLIFNSGAAFSFGANTTWIFTIFAVLVTFAMPYFMHRMGEAKYQYLLGLIWAGTIGNLLDRLFREPGFGVGHVVDFIRYGNCFIGNIADIALVVGALALVLCQFLDVQKAQKALQKTQKQNSQE